MCMCLYVYHRSVWCQQRSEGGIKFTATGFMNGCQSLCGCWELNLGSLKEQLGALNHLAISPTPHLPSF